GQRRRRSPDGQRAFGGVERRPGRRRGCLRRSARRGRPFRRRDPQHSGAAARPWTGSDKHDAPRAAAASRADRRLRPLRQPAESFLMERTEVLELMSTLKLFGMRAAYDEVMANGIKRRHEPPRIVGDLLSAEIAEKQARSIKYQLTIAKLPL